MLGSIGGPRIAALAIALLCSQQAAPTTAAPVSYTSAPIDQPVAAASFDATIPSVPTANAMPETPAEAPDLGAAEEVPAPAVEVATQGATDLVVEPASEPVAEPIAEPVPQPAVQHVAAAPIAQPVPFSCASTFCYPRLGISAPLVPYSDCGGTTDLGSSIRLHMCLPATYIVAHAYTDFGRIVGWQAGDVVFVNGTRFTITGAVRQPGCVALTQPQTRLSLQTSLTTSDCGPILIVQGR
jgi:hypothetical protein